MWVFQRVTALLGQPTVALLVLVLSVARLRNSDQASTIQCLGRWFPKMAASMAKFLSAVAGPHSPTSDPVPASDPTPMRSIAKPCGFAGLVVQGFILQWKVVYSLQVSECAINLCKQ